MNGMNNNGGNSNNFRHRRNFKKPGGSAGGHGGHRNDRGDFRRQNTSHSGNEHRSGQARHPELDIVIDGKAVKKASMMRDKYQALARDAQSGGDRVLAENYNQHADHYNRILLAANELRPQSARIDTGIDGDDASDDNSNYSTNVETGNSASTGENNAPAVETAPANATEDAFVAA